MQILLRKSVVIVVHPVTLSRLAFGLTNNSMAMMRTGPNVIGLPSLRQGLPLYPVRCCYFGPGREQGGDSADASWGQIGALCFGAAANLSQPPHLRE